MTGRGHVSRGGPPYVEQLSETVTSIKLSVGPMDNNAYLLRSSTGATLLIDAANDADTLLEAVGQERQLDVVVTTHRHRDHWEALAAVHVKTSAALIAGTPDVAAISSGAGVNDVRGVWDGDEVSLGDAMLTVIGLVGHTPGSIALLYSSGTGPDHLFTGDSLFPGGPGRTMSPGDFSSLMDDLEHKIFGWLDDTTVVHPGHGDDTTLGAERPQLAEWRSRGW